MTFTDLLREEQPDDAFEILLADIEAAQAEALAALAVRHPDDAGLEWPPQADRLDFERELEARQRAWGEP